MLSRLAAAATENFEIPGSLMVTRFVELVENLGRQIPPEGMQAVRESLGGMMHPTTAMPLKGYEDFENTGVYRTLLTHGPTWHHSYSEDPIAGRVFNDRRLFGAPAPEVAFSLALFSGTPARWLGDCVTLHLGKTVYPYLAKHSEDGRVVYLRWSRSVLERASVCYGDSQQNFFVMPYSPEAVAGLALLHGIAHHMACPTGVSLPDGAETLLDYFGGRFYGKRWKNPYFELQIHGGVTPDDIEEIGF